MYISILIILFVYGGLGGFGRPGAFSFSGALVAQNCSKSPRARSGPLRAAQNRSEPLRVAQSGRSELFEEPLRVAQSAHRAAQRRSESLGACPEPLRAALNRRARSEPLRACSWPLVRAQSLLKTACALEIDAAVRACSASPLRSNLLFEETVR